MRNGTQRLVLYVISGFVVFWPEFVYYVVCYGQCVSSSGDVAVEIIKLTYLLT